MITRQLLIKTSEYLPPEGARPGVRNWEPPHPLQACAHWSLTVTVAHTFTSQCAHTYARALYAPTNIHMQYMSIYIAPPQRGPGIGVDSGPGGRLASLGLWLTIEPTPLSTVLPQTRGNY